MKPATSAVPESFICALTGDVMTDPVIDPEGHTYERSAIESWLARNATSPITRSPLHPRDLVPNRALRDAIEKNAQESANLANKVQSSSSSSSSSSLSSSPPSNFTVPVSSSSSYSSLSSSPPSSLAPIGLASPPKFEGIQSSVAIKIDSNANNVLVSLRPPRGDGPQPLDICCVIDVSGSMNDQAKLTDKSSDAETSGFSLLDIVKHAVKTVINVMSDKDRLALVSFSSRATVVLGLTAMNAEGKKKAEVALNTLRPDGATNLWDGIYSGLEVLREGGIGKKTRTPTICVLTDGCPNVEPPRGHIPMLKRYKEQNKMSCIINTFGFGYSLDSKLLTDIAVEAGGLFAFIPDASFVGTVFVNATANLLATLGRNVSLCIETKNGAKISQVVGGHKKEDHPWGTILDLGTIQYGQSKDIVLRMTDMPSSGLDYIEATLFYNSVTSEPMIAKAVGSERNGNENDIKELNVSLLRLMAVNMLSDHVKKNGKEGAHIHTTRTAILTVVDEIQKSPVVDDPRVAGLLQDIQGQVSEAVSKAEWYKKWGCHYLPSLARAHLFQQCNNFKDFGVQLYGGEIFNQARDVADAVFNKLPPPTPSRSIPETSYSSSYASGAQKAYAPASPVYRAPVSMAVYNNRYGGCVKGSCLVEMADGTQKPAELIEKGDLVLTNGKTSQSQVLCVVKTLIKEGELPLVELEGGLLVTPWHPVKRSCDTTWHFPCEIGAQKMVSCDSIYTFVLSGDHVMMINGVEYVTLGHGFVGDKREHAFFGTARVVESLRSVSESGFARGCVVLSSGCFHRDKEGNVCAISFADGNSA